MTYLFSAKNYKGLDTLVASLGAIRLWKWDGESFWDKSRKNRIKIPVGSVIIPWGAGLPEMEGIRVLNGREKELSKTDEVTYLTSGGLASIKAYPEESDTPASWSGSKGKYLGRRFGDKFSDILVSRDPHYYTEKMIFEKEFVINSFNGKSIRAGQKIPLSTKVVATTTKDYLANPTDLAHPWIKTEEFGWRVDYNVGSTPDMRAIAHKAVKVLGLTFAEVTIGKIAANGALVVVSINRAPDLSSPNSVKGYTKSIQKWIDTPVGGTVANI